MESAQLYLIVADVLLVFHVVIVLFIVLGLAVILLGKWRDWGWVRNPWFRLAHLLAIITVILESWFGVTCPLTAWEILLRTKAGEVTYTGAFVAHWLESLLYYQAPGWVFVVVYSLFGAIVIFSWFWVKPRKFFS